MPRGSTAAGGEAALVGDERDVVPPVAKDGRGGRANTRRPFDRLREGPRPDGDDEEVLHVDEPAGMGSTGDHVDHRQRQQGRPVGTERLPERQPLRPRMRERTGDRSGEHRVGPEPCKICGAVELAHRPVDGRLVTGVEAAERRGDLADERGDHARHALAAVAPASVPPLVRLVRTGGGP